jgi:hypothetical protein
MLAGPEVDETRMRVFQAALTQAEELWEAAAAVGAASRPLPLYYCLSQAGRALAAAWTQDVNWRPTAHGLTSRVPNQAQELPRFAVRVAGLDGMYSVVAAATDSTVFHGTATVAELWASLPELPQAGFLEAAVRPMYVEAVRLPAEGEAPNELRIFQHLLAPKHARIAYPRPPGLSEALARIVENEEEITGLPELLRDYPSMRGVSAEIHALRTAFGEERVLVLSFPDEAGELRSLPDIAEEAPRTTGLVTRGTEARYFIRPRIGSGEERPPSQLMTLWALVYAFSQLARYEPELWVAALNPDTSPIAVDLEHALDAALDLVPELLVPAVTNGVMPRLIREHIAEERAEQDAPNAGEVEHDENA